MMIKIERKYGCGEAPEWKEKNGIPFMTFPSLNRFPWLVNAFSSRMGGVSPAPSDSLNFSYTLPEGAPGPEDAVRENYRRMAGALGVLPESMVLSHQTHTVHVRRITGEDKGNGAVYPNRFRDVDGMITNEPGITLVTVYADCIPLYFADPVHRAVGLSHSGWRGTVNRMGKVTLQAMSDAFGTSPADVFACIGPGICPDCYEVGPEVAGEFILSFPGKEKQILREKGNGKFLLNLWEANRLILLEAGVPEENIASAGYCTLENPLYFFSHRRSGRRRGNLGAFLGILAE